MPTSALESIRRPKDTVPFGKTHVTVGTGRADPSHIKVTSSPWSRVILAGFTLPEAKTEEKERNP